MYPVSAVLTAVSTRPKNTNIVEITEKARRNCVRRRKNALLIQFGVDIVWDNVD